MRNTKDKIIDVAIKYIKAGQNLETISLQTIANEAEIGKSTVYEYFTSKEALIEDAYLSLIKEYHHKLMDNIISDTFEESFKKQIKVIIEVMNEAKSIMQAILHKHHQIINANIRAEIDLISSKINEQYHNILKLGVKEKVINSKYEENNNKYIIKALMTGLGMQYVANETELNEDQIIILIYDSVIKHLR